MIKCACGKRAAECVRYTECINKAPDFATTDSPEEQARVLSQDRDVLAYAAQMQRDSAGIAQHAPGAKLDQDKVDVTLLQDFNMALREVARVGDYGQRKYTRSGWKSVKDGVRRYTRAMLDHWFKEEEEGLYDQDPYYDTPEGAPFKGTIRHDAQVAWNALARLQLRLTKEKAHARGNESARG